MQDKKIEVERVKTDEWSLWKNGGFSFLKEKAELKEEVGKEAASAEGKREGATVESE